MVRTLFALVIVAQWSFAQESPHGPLKFPCTTCHGTESWEMKNDALFDHADVGFPLTGQHKTVKCQSCHQDLKFAKMKSECLSCHTDVHKSELGTNCLRCHTTLTWQIADMIQKHQQTRFPLLGRHTTVNCQTCHASAAEHQYMGIPVTCIGCHRSDYQLTSAPNHTASGFSTDCAKCHTVTSYTWGSGFDHSLTRFPLSGAHRAQPCVSCHGDNVFASKPVECITCHQLKFQQARNPNHVLGNFSQNCQTCHNTTAWQPANFDHNSTRFALTGSHASQPCQSCHVNGNYQLLFSSCVQCHQSNFQQAVNPNHVAGNFSQNCQTCHNTSAWRPATFDHNATKFPLTGEHAHQPCAACHVNNNYQLVYTGCAQCHRSNFQQTVNPNHVTGNFSQNCQTCHTTTTWQSATFDHSTTKFQLTGTHSSQPCAACHVNNNYQLAYTNCVQCHLSNFQQSVNPNHVTGNFSQNCQTCHNTTTWRPATFDHSTTKFQLTGTHTSQPCAACHVNNNYQLAYTNCVQCHLSNFQQSVNPNHVTGNFSQNCQTCHNTTTWRPATFDHSTTKFQLTGTHTSQPCAACHVNNNYQLAYTNCVQCHLSNFQQSVNPNHVTGNFSQNCQTCHNTITWRPATFDHSTTKFQLTGVHTSQPCAACHVNNNYQLVYTNCVQCHLSNFQQSVNPNHVAGNFSQTCQTCHTTTAWKPSTFSHSSTPFALTGAHQAVACNLCHVNNQYQNLPTDCYSCHTSNYAGATNPGHSAGSFSHDCTQCHTTTAWQPATFSHSGTKFPLAGAHLTQTCQACHVNGNYKLVYADCYQCHATQFQQATSQNHVSQSFPHNCTMCHNTSVWTPNTMNHDANWFRIYSGRHVGRWTQCSQCHTTPGNLAAWSCASGGCHATAHNQGQNCYSCHRNS